MKKQAKSNAEFGLETKSFPKHKQWAVDQDYTDKLSAEEAAWLGQFNQEFYRNRVKKGDKNALHNTDALRKECYSRENAANRDLYAVKNCGGMVGDFQSSDQEGNSESIYNMVADCSNPNEDTLIDMIDNSRKKSKK